MALVCPICRHPIDEAACDESSDRAPCPACGEDWSSRLTRTFSGLAAVARGPVPKRFTLSREGTDADERVTLTYAPAFSSVYGILLVALLVLGGGAFVVGLLFRDGNLEGGWVCLAFWLILALLLFWTGFYNRGERTFTFGRGKGTYRKSIFWRGRLRTFPIDDSTCFAWHDAPMVLGKSLPVLDHVEVGGRKVLTIRQAFRPEDCEFFSAVFLDWLPRDPEDFRPIEPKEETPEEAAARRVCEAAEAEELRRANSFWRKIGAVVPILLVVGLRFGYDFFYEGSDKVRSRHLGQVVQAFVDRADYHAIAQDIPFRAGYGYRNVLDPVVRELDVLAERTQRFKSARAAKDAAALLSLRMELAGERVRTSARFSTEQSRREGRSSKLGAFFSECYRRLDEACKNETVKED